jgi:hypothetical protein
MRDIKPSNFAKRRTETDKELPPETHQLYEKQEAKKQPRPRFSGSKVDVTNVHIPRQQQSGAPRTYPPRQAKRSLFAEARASSSPKMRLGYKERKIILILLGLGLIAIALAGIIFLPQAKIELVLATAPLLVDQQLTIRQGNPTLPNVIPGASFDREVSIDGVAPVLSTEIVGRKATGTVNVINRTIDEQQIVEQSRLVTDDGTLFYMQRHAIVPPSSSATVLVEAAEAGEQGNVSSGELNFAALDQSSQSLVYAEITEPLTGGSGEKVPVVKQEDLDQAKEAAQVAARQKVEEEVRAELDQGWTILEESWDMELLQFETGVATDDQRDSIAYAARVLVHVLSYQEAALEDQLKQALDAQLDQDYMLFPGPISFTKAVDSVDWETGEGKLTVRVTHTTIPALSLETLRDKLAGRSQDEATTYLNGLNGVESVSLKLSPFWVRQVPRIDRRIFIDLTADQEP